MGEFLRDAAERIIVMKTVNEKVSFLFMVVKVFLRNINESTLALVHKQDVKLPFPPDTNDFYAD